MNPINSYTSVAKKVYAFEPHPKNYALLEQNTKHFPTQLVIRIFLSYGFR